MSRYAASAPFDLAAEFVAARPFLAGGVNFMPGSAIPKGTISERILRNLYSQRKVSMIQGTAQPVRKPVQAKPAAPVENPQETAEPGKYRVKQAGLGGFKVVDANGAPITPGFKTYDEAKAAMERLSA
ncbi:hypothetical protein UFOVP32_7 [uncultured Caudovirales phage]|uniref:Uncharacterized protein n=1 Tax=uncultured Caudovirales phage TaxID=2100421 RepID=A0A6J5KJM8_9CAUD|nr:hypothetical protein UFOVP32_7 [uncultured Caudovirales phage]CAB4123821.1 hypothetical protein UFOVP50_69 [uncultured Caudovirales phage]